MKPLVLKRRILLLITSITIVGIILAAQLQKIHYLTNTDSNYDSICAVNETVNCETVALSEYSVFFGIPVSIWGLTGYIFLFLLSIATLKTKKHPSFLSGFFFIISSVFLGTTALLAFISVTCIQSLCLFCVGTYAINTSLFILSSFWLFKINQSFKTKIKSLFEDIFDSKFLLITLITIAVSFLIIFKFFVNPYWDFETNLSIQENSQTQTKTETEHWIGAKNPKITIVEYSDYQCPYCRLAHTKVRTVLNNYKNSIRLIHKQYPLDQACNSKIKRKFHQFACNFAKAAQCASNQQKFWEMNDALFTANGKKEAQQIDVNQLAKDIQIDESAFKTCMKSDTAFEPIRDDIKQGNLLGITGTPSFYIDGKKIKLPTKKSIDALLTDK